MNKKTASLIAIGIGTIICIMGIATVIPGDYLTTKLYLAGDGSEYTYIREYVGGDAYNYIIGAALVSGQIMAATISAWMKVLVGALMIVMGLLSYPYNDEKKELVKHESSECVETIVEECEVH